MATSVVLTKWGVVRGVDPHNIMYHALSRGELDVVIFLRNIGHDWQGSTYIYVIGSGNLLALTYVKYHRWIHRGAIGAAIKSGKLSMVEYLRNNGRSLNDHKSSVPMKPGNITVLAYALRYGFEWNDSTCTNATVAKNLSALAYARSNGCNWGRLNIDAVMYLGDLSILSYAMSHNCPRSRHTFIWSGYITDLSMLMYIRCRQYSWDRYRVQDYSTVVLNEWVKLGS